MSYGETDRPDHARSTLAESLEIARSSGDATLVRRITEQMHRYRLPNDK